MIFDGATTLPQNRVYITPSKSELDIEAVLKGVKQANVQENV